MDPEFGVPLKWEMPLLEGYAYRFLANRSFLSVAGRFWSLLNPGIVPILLKERYDAVMIPGYAYASYLLGFLGGWLSGTPIFLRGEMVVRPESPWRLKTWCKKALLRLLLKGTQACLAIGTPSRLFYERHRVPKNRIFFSPYSVDNELFSKESRRWRSRRSEVKRSLGISPEIPVVLFCGKLVPRKCPGDLLAAFGRVRRPAHLLFVGEGLLRVPLQRQALGRSNVTFSGFIDQKEIPQYYAAADLFVLPSKEEVAPLVVNEAMACGLPVVVSDAVPSVVDFVKSGENGFVFPLGDVQALAACLNRLLEDTGLCLRMGELSQELIQEWSPEASARGILQALQDRCTGRLSRCG